MGKVGHGRNVKGNRGIGSGKSSEKTSNSKPAKLSGYKKTKGDGMGGNKGKVSYSKGRDSKNMGSAGAKYKGPKIGRDPGSKTY